MAVATANGHTVLSGSISEPLQGVWLAELTLGVDDALSGTVEIAIDGVTWTGTAIPTRSDIESGRSLAKVVGGAGALAAPVVARAYNNVLLSTVVEKLMEDAGETLSTDSDDLSATYRARWIRTAGRASDALEAVAESAGLTWRVLRDGTVFLGTDAFPELTLDHERIDYDPQTAAMLIAPRESSGPVLRPGVTFDGRQVAHVTTTIQSRGVRQRARFHEDRIRRLLGAIAGIRDRQLAYLKAHPCKVVGQNADDTLELVPDDEALGGTLGNGLSRVPIRYGFPGVTVKVAVGARCDVLFEGGDPSRPVATHFEPGSLDEIVLTASTKVTIAAPDIDLGDASGTVARYGDPVSVGASAGALTFTGPPGTESDVDA